MRALFRRSSAGEDTAASSPRDGGSPAARGVPSSPLSPTAAAPASPSAAPPPSAAAPPSHFCCPISMELMADPVILATGQSYHRASIVRWLEAGHKTCPSTGTRLRHLELVPNFALRSAIVVRVAVQRAAGGGHAERLLPGLVTDRLGTAPGVG